MNYKNITLEIKADGYIEDSVSEVVENAFHGVEDQDSFLVSVEFVKNERKKELLEQFSEYIHDGGFLKLNLNTTTGELTVLKKGNKF